MKSIFFSIAILSIGSFVFSQEIISSINGNNIMSISQADIDNYTIHCIIKIDDAQKDLDVTEFKLKIPGQKTVLISGNQLNLKEYATTIVSDSSIYIFDILSANKSNENDATEYHSAPIIVDIL